MKFKLNVFISLFVGLIILSSLPCKSQTLELNTTQTFTVFSPAFFPFTPTANNEVQTSFDSNPNLTVMFSNFLGSPCAIAPAADFSEIGPQINITGNGTFVLDFSGAMENANTFGLSFVPQGGTCLFDIFITPPASSSTSSSGNIISGPQDTFPPNAFTVAGTFLDASLVSQLSNEPDNPQCQNSISGINSTILSDSNFFNLVLDAIFEGGTEVNLQRSSGKSSNLKDLAVKPSIGQSSVFTQIFSDKQDKEKAVYNIKLTNMTDETQIYVTGIFPSISEESTLMIGGNRIVNPEPKIEVTLKEQDLAALAAVQHSIVSATMPWQLSNNGGYFITKGGGCVGPFCTIVESGMVIIIPGGACTPEKLNRRKAGYPTVNPSKLFDPFPVASKTIQIPSQNIVDPTHPLISKVVRENAYLIFQPLPPKAKITQQLKINVTTNDNDND
ncbi:MAG: hypothetical protein A3B68_04265 [Candidatus Melainabacteria bacterium RIFCSPHIGHO2_02_FULL_34_12]|nr:MAG: hypothetical protein A3B68_04265 [Candidatus Melainabacteria bacterium RIFCSPHIGHO2_02_FULL_34_12]